LAVRRTGTYEVGGLTRIVVIRGGFLRLAMERIYMAVHDGFAAHAGTG
jgi:hypothetical protein